MLVCLLQHRRKVFWLLKLMCSFCEKILIKVKVLVFQCVQLFVIP